MLEGWVMDHGSPTQPGGNLEVLLDGEVVATDAGEPLPRETSTVPAWAARRCCGFTLMLPGVPGDLARVAVRGAPADGRVRRDAAKDRARTRTRHRRLIAPAPFTPRSSGAPIIGGPPTDAWHACNRQR